MFWADGMAATALQRNSRSTALLVRAPGVVRVVAVGCWVSRSAAVWWCSARVAQQKAAAGGARRRSTAPSMRRSISKRLFSAAESSECNQAARMYATTAAPGNEGCSHGWWQQTNAFTAPHPPCILVRVLKMRIRVHVLLFKPCHAAVQIVGSGEALAYNR